KHALLDTDERLAYLTEVSKWYAEGLLDNDYFAVDKKTQATKVLNSQTGATYAPGGSGMGTWIPAFKETDPNVKFCSAPPMTPERGKYPKLSRMNVVYGKGAPGAAISTDCKNIE